MFLEKQDNECSRAPHHLAPCKPCISNLNTILDTQDLDKRNVGKAAPVGPVNMPWDTADTSAGLCAGRGGWEDSSPPGREMNKHPAPLVGMELEINPDR